MNSETRFQIWWFARVARTVLVIAVVALLAVVAGSLMRPAAPETTPTEGSERVHPPGIPDTYHRLDVRV